MPPSFYCRWWYAMTGQALKACQVPRWLWGAVYSPRPWWWGDQPGLGYPPAAIPAEGAAPGAAPAPAVGDERARIRPVEPGAIAPPGWAGLGQFRPSPRPGAQYGAPVGPAGPLGAPWAQRAGPGVPEPYIRGPGIPGAPIGPTSPGEPGSPLGPSPSEGGSIGP